jgi:orotate phosphoribosyltransferase
MQDYQQEFITFALAKGALRFGSFTLKSGRQSPYFFNTGVFDSGVALARLGEYYAAALAASAVPFDMLYGPAYKGIPLGAAVAIAYANRGTRDLPFCFNRKEAKDHGEGGLLLGAKLVGQVMIVDDVISAGTSVNESATIIRQHGAVPAGVIISLDRQERGASALSAAAEVRRNLGVPVLSIVSLADIVEYLRRDGGHAKEVTEIDDYRNRYGAITEL